MFSWARLPISPPSPSSPSPLPQPLQHHPQRVDHHLMPVNRVLNRCRRRRVLLGAELVAGAKGGDALEEGVVLCDKIAAWARHGSTASVSPANTTTKVPMAISHRSRSTAMNARKPSCAATKRQPRTLNPLPPLRLVGGSRVSEII